MSRPTPPAYKTRNWPAYNEALKRRGSLTIWFDPGMAWAAQPTGKRPSHAVPGLATTRGSRDDRRVKTLLPPAAYKIKAVHPGQADIDHRYIEGLVLQHLLQLRQRPPQLLPLQRTPWARAKVEKIYLERIIDFKKK